MCYVLPNSFSTSHLWWRHWHSPHTEEETGLAACPVLQWVALSNGHSPECVRLESEGRKYHLWTYHAHVVYVCMHECMFTCMHAYMSGEHTCAYMWMPEVAIQYLPRSRSPLFYWGRTVPETWHLPVPACLGIWWLCLPSTCMYMCMYACLKVSEIK